MGEGGGSRAYVQVVSADIWRMRGILIHGGEKIMLLVAKAKSQSMTEACDWPVFMEVGSVQIQS